MSVFAWLTLFLLPCVCNGEYENWKDRVIYQIITDRFYDGNTSNDNVPVSTTGCWSGESGDNLNLWIGGDWAGVTTQIGYIQSLTSNASLWLSPFYNQVTTNFYSSCAYHGYWPNYTNPSSYSSCSVSYEPYFGTSTEFGDMLSTIMSNNMQIIQDQVSNHCGYGCDWYNNNPNDFVTTPSCTLPGCNGGGCTESTCWTCDLDGLPDILQNSGDTAGPWVYDVACQTAWQTEYASTYGSIWGIRFDAVEEQYPSFFTDSEGVVAVQVAINPNLFTFGEYDDGGGTICAGSQYVKGANTYGLTSLLNFAVYAASSNLYESSSSSSNWISQVTSVYNYYSVSPYTIDTALTMVNFYDSQDQDRIFNNLNGRYGTCCSGNYLANAYMMFGSLIGIPGIPVFLYGVEIGMLGSASTNGNRNFMPSWAFSPPSYPNFVANSGYYAPNTQSVATQIYNTVWKSISVRNTFESLRRGGYWQLWSQCTSSCPYGATSDIASWLRSDQVDQPIIAVMNNGDDASGYMLIPINGNASQSISLTSVDTAKLVDGTVLDDVFVQPANTGQSSLTISGGYLRPLQPYGKTISLFRPRPAVGNCAVQFVINGLSTISGQGVYLTGSIPELNIDSTTGDWATWNAIRMGAQSASTWFLNINYLKPGTSIQFKTQLQPYQPSTGDTPCNSTTIGSGWYIAYENGNNHEYTLPSTCSGLQTITVTNQGWGYPMSSC